MTLYVIQNWTLIHGWINLSDAEIEGQLCKNGVVALSSIEVLQNKCLFQSADLGGGQNRRVSCSKIFPKWMRPFSVEGNNQINDQEDVSTSTLQKIWLILSLTLLLFTLSSHGALQGADISLKINAFAGFVFEANTPRAIISMWSIAIVSALYLMANSILRIHVQATCGSITERYPFRLIDVPPNTKIGRIAAGLAIFVFTVIPLIGLVHFWRTFLENGTLCSFNDAGILAETKPNSSVFAWPNEFNVEAFLFDGYRLSDNESGVCTSKLSTTFFPVAQPLLMVALTLWAIWSLLTVLQSLRK